MGKSTGHWKFADEQLQAGVSIIASGQLVSSGISAWKVEATGTAEKHYDCIRQDEPWFDGLRANVQRFGSAV